MSHCGNKEENRGISLYHRGQNSQSLIYTISFVLHVVKYTNIHIKGLRGILLWKTWEGLEK